MLTYELLDINTNIKSVVFPVLIDQESLDLWFDDFEALVKQLTRTVFINDMKLILSIDIYSDKATVMVTCDEEIMQAIVQSMELQRQLIKHVITLLKDANPIFMSEYLTRIPNAYCLYKNKKFYVELAHEQKELQIEVNSVQFDDDIYSFDIDWEYLV